MSVTMNNKMSAVVVLGIGLVAIGLGACDEKSAPEPSESRPIVVLPPVPEIEESEANRAVRESLVRILRDQDPYSRARSLGELMPTLGAESVSVVKSIFHDTTLDLRAMDMELLIHFWALHDPANATRWAIELGPPSYRTSNIFAALKLWVKVDPSAAVEASEVFAGEHPDTRRAIPAALVRGWYSAGDPPELAAFLERMGPGIPRQSAVAVYLRARIQAEGVESAMKWARAAPDDDETYKLAIYRQLALALMLFDREAGLRWCEENCEGPYGKDMRSLIGRRLLSDGGPTALAFLRAGPPGHSTNLGVRSIYSLWVRKNPSEAMDWISQQVTGGELADWLKPVLPVYVRALAVDSPLEAIQWAEQIDEDREYALVNIVDIWLKSDRDTAIAWLDASSLSEEAKARVRR